MSRRGSTKTQSLEGTKTGTVSQETKDERKTFRLRLRVYAGNSPSVHCWIFRGTPGSRRMETSVTRLRSALLDTVLAGLSGVPQQIKRRVRTRWYDLTNHLFLRLSDGSKATVSLRSASLAIFAECVEVNRENLFGGSKEDIFIKTSMVS
jgi:hypothetical protein